MSEIREGLRLGRAVTELASKIFDPVLTRCQADVCALATIEQALAEQVADYIGSPFVGSDFMEALVPSQI